MSVPLEQQDKTRDADFSKAMHGSSVTTGAFTAMFTKDKKAHNAAVDEYFKFWEEGKGAARMGEEDSEVRRYLARMQKFKHTYTKPQERRRHYATLTRQ